MPRASFPLGFGYGSQSREIMEVEAYSAKSGCHRAFERRLETSTMEEFQGTMNKRMDEMESRMQSAIGEIMAMMKEMRMSQNQSTTGGIEKKEKAAVIIQAFLRTPLVRVKLERKRSFWGAHAKDWVLYAKDWVRYATFDLGPWWKDHRGRQEEKARRERACEHLVGEWVCLKSGF